MSNFISNAFQVPNAVIDDLMANLSPNSLKCYLLIVRQTTGWGKISDRISESQFMDKTGIKNVKTVRVALAELVSLGLINQDKNRGQITEYSLVLDSKNQCQKTVVPKNGTSTKKRTEVVPKIGSKPVPKIGTLQKTITKTTNTKEKNNTKSSKLDFSAWPSEPSEQIFKDWKAMRDKKRAPITQTVINRLASKLVAAGKKFGMSVDDVLGLCVERGWQGFEIEWLANVNQGKPQGVNYVGSDFTAPQGWEEFK